MAKCDEGYICSVCGEDVAAITDSGLYLMFIIGEIESRQLFATPEHHLRCNRVLTQYIVDAAFEPVAVEGDWSKQNMDPEEARQREELVTAGWRRLCEVKQLNIPVGEYPLESVRKTK